MRLRCFLPAFVLTGACFIAGCAVTTPPPVSEKVQKYYDENVIHPATAATPSTAPTILATPVQKVAFIGDSYAQGTGASAPTSRWASKLSFNLGWTEHNIARGGTGYLATPDNPVGACGLSYCPSYFEMIPEAAKAAPDMVIVSGGRNDLGSDQDLFIEAANTFYTELREALPEAKLVAISPMWDATDTPADLLTHGEAVKAAVLAVGGKYIDVGQPLEGHPDWITSDGVDPADPGHSAIYVAVKNALIRGD